MTRGHALVEPKPRASPRPVARSSSTAAPRHRRSRRREEERNRHRCGPRRQIWRACAQIRRARHRQARHAVGELVRTIVGGGVRQRRARVRIRYRELLPAAAEYSPLRTPPPCRWWSLGRREKRGGEREEAGGQIRCPRGKRPPPLVEKGGREPTSSQPNLSPPPCGSVIAACREDAGERPEVDAALRCGGVNDAVAHERGSDGFERKRRRRDSKGTLERKRIR
ncbi:hypothetical protein OsJ_26182 [Oryza sativa Japonica Group]|uniref:Uncharacterized protein n=1 Tax=Oryza sativa subsp. japonica TaxID=39947 RepID=Q6ZCP4_ORYSJ|nr:hypothetical protein OsJ_26182 [Oryza sativa Japonica Group]BAC99545.1 hypothetical protein [Oryza sativa Japonica Group]